MCVSVSVQIMHYVCQLLVGIRLVSLIFCGIFILLFFFNFIFIFVQCSCLICCCCFSDGLPPKFLLNIILTNFLWIPRQILFCKKEKTKKIYKILFGINFFARLFCFNTCLFFSIGIFVLLFLFFLSIKKNFSFKALT